MAARAEMMTLPTGMRVRNKMKTRIEKHGMTLLELICVMALLATVMAFSAPAFSGFFKGRSLMEESRRFLSLTRYARSQAISRSVIMELWIQPGSGDYGLSPQVEYGEKAKYPIQYHVAEGLAFEVEEGVLDQEGRANILFWPDGAIDETSLKSLFIREGQEEVEIAQTDIGMGYSLKDESEK